MLQLTVFSHMRTDLGHRIAHRRIAVQEVVVFPGVPLREGRKLLRDGREQADDDTDRGRLHVGAELLHCRLIGHAVVAVELNKLPHGEDDGSEHEDGRPVLQLVAAVDRRV